MTKARKEINMAKKLESPIRNSNAKIEALEYKIDQLERENKVLKAMADLRSRQEKEALELLEQIHQFLDAVPHSISRESSGLGSAKRAPLTRLAAWLSCAKLKCGSY
jgi:hypothetical protein